MIKRKEITSFYSMSPCRLVQTKANTSAELFALIFKVENPSTTKKKSICLEDCNVNRPRSRSKLCNLCN